MFHPATAGQAARMQRFVPRKSAVFSCAGSAGNFFPQIPQIEFPQMSADLIPAKG
jgi:hypothetical protein